MVEGCLTATVDSHHQDGGRMFDTVTVDSHQEDGGGMFDTETVDSNQSRWWKDV